MESKVPAGVHSPYSQKRYTALYPDQDPEGSFGIWCNEFDQLIQYPKHLREWKGQPLAEFRKEMRLGRFYPGRDW